MNDMGIALYRLNGTQQKLIVLIGGSLLYKDGVKKGEE